MKDKTLSKKEKSAEIRRISAEIRKLTGPRRKRVSRPSVGKEIDVPDFGKPQVGPLGPKLANQYQNQTFPKNLPNQVPTIVPVPSNTNQVAMEAMQRKLELKDAQIREQKEKAELLKKTQEEQQKLQSQIADIKKEVNESKQVDSALPSRAQVGEAVYIKDFKERAIALQEDVKVIMEEKKKAEEDGNADEIRDLEEREKLLKSQIKDLESKVVSLVSKTIPAEIQATANFDLNVLGGDWKTIIEPFYKTYVALPVIARPSEDMFGIS